MTQIRRVVHRWIEVNLACRHVAVKLGRKGTIGQGQTIVAHVTLHVIGRHDNLGRL